MNTKLSRLDKRPANASSVKRLNELAILASKGDLDYRRCIAAALPDLQIESSPNGTQIFDNAGVKPGTTPLVIEDIPESEHTFGVALRGHDFVAVEFTSELNAPTTTPSISLTEVTQTQWEATINHRAGLETGRHQS